MLSWAGGKQPRERMNWDGAEPIEETTRVPVCASDGFAGRRDLTRLTPQPATVHTVYTEHGQ